MTDLIERAKDFCRTRIFIRPYEDAQDGEDPLALIAELADALEVADKRIEQLEAERDALLGKTQEWSVIHGDWSDKSQDADWLRLRYFDATARIEHLEADCEMKDKRIDWTVADNAKKAIRIEQLEIRLAALADVAGIFMDFGSNGSEVAAQIKEALADKQQQADG